MNYLNAADGMSGHFALIDKPQNNLLVKSGERALEQLNYSLIKGRAW